MSRALQFALGFTLFVGIPTGVVHAAPAVSVADTIATFAATVQTADGAPIAGATIIARSYADSGQKLFFSARSDATGRVQIEAPTRKEFGDKFALEAVIRAPGYALESLLLAQENRVYQLTPQTVALSGRVVDENGAPVAGATVQLVQLGLPLSDRRPHKSMMGVYLEDMPAAMSSALQVRTDANGDWTLPDLPARAHAGVELNDARFQRSRVYIPLGAGVAARLSAPMVALPGAHLSGRVMAPDGTPQSGARVNVRVEDDKGYAARAETVSARDGSYTMHGLAAGTATIRVAPQSLDAAPLRMFGIPLQSGETTRAPDAQLEGGVLLSGVVTDAATKKPLEGVKIGAGGPGGFSTSTPTDEKGRYTIRVAPAETNFFLSSSPGGYLRDVIQPRMSVAAGDKTGPDFALRRALTLHGTALDEAGQPAKGAFIYTGTEMDGTLAFPDQDGNWKITGIDPTQQVRGQVSSRRGIVNPGELKLKIGGSWALIEEVTIPGNALEEAAQTPIELRLRRLELQDFTVRVLDETGAPIVGASVSIDITDGNSHDRFGYGATTDADGAVVVERMRPEQSAKITPFMRGYELKNAGAIAAVETAGARARATDAVMVAPMRVLRGRVVDAAGAPVENAQVAALAPGDARNVERFARTDMAGRFELSGLRPGQLVVGAAQNYQFGQTAVEAGAREIEIKLAVAPPQPPPRDHIRARAVLQNWLERAGENPDVQLTNLAASLAASDSDALQLAESMTAGQRVSFDKALARLRDNYALPGGKDKERIEARLAREEIGALLLTDRDAALRLYNRVAANLPATPPRLHEWQERTQRDAELWGIARSLEHTDADFWREALDRDFALEAREVALHNARNDKGVFNLGERGKGNYALAIAQSDVGAALEWIAPLTLPERLRALHQIIPIIVARGLPRDEALKLLRASHEEAANRSALFEAELAALAAPLDARLSEDWFASARRELAKPAPAGNERLRAGAAKYAFYRAPNDPAQGRLLLESEWLRVGETDTDFNVQAAAEVAWAMAPLDFERALTMLAQLQARGDQTYRERSVRHHLLVWLLASDAERATLNFWYPQSAALPE